VDIGYMIAGLVGIFVFVFIWWIIRYMEKGDPMNKFFRETFRDVVKKQMAEWFPQPPVETPNLPPITTQEDPTPA
jgi:hypothetical protein